MKGRYQVLQYLPKEPNSNMTSTRLNVADAELEQQDGGAALIATFSNDDGGGGGESGVFVRFQSYDESGQHSRFREFQGKHVRITVEAMDTPDTPMDVAGALRVSADGITHLANSHPMQLHTDDFRVGYESGLHRAALALRSRAHWLDGAGVEATAPDAPPKRPAPPAPPATEDPRALLDYYDLTVTYGTRHEELTARERLLAAITRKPA